MKHKNKINSLSMVWILVIMALAGCSKDRIVVVEVPSSSSSSGSGSNSGSSSGSSSGSGTQPTTQPSYIRINSITPSPGTTLQINQTYDLIINYTAFYDQGGDICKVYLTGYSEATGIGVRQGLFYSDLERSANPNQTQTGTFSTRVIVANYSTHPTANPKGEQPSKVLVRIELAKPLGVIRSVVARAEQTYTIR